MHSQLSDVIQMDPAASFWLKAADETISKRDVVDALNDAMALLEACRQRARSAGIPVGSDTHQVVVDALFNLVSVVDPGQGLGYLPSSVFRAALRQALDALRAAGRPIT